MTKPVPHHWSLLQIQQGCSGKMVQIVTKWAGFEVCGYPHFRTNDKKYNSVLVIWWNEQCVGVEDSMHDKDKWKDYYW